MVVASFNKLTLSPQISLLDSGLRHSQLSGKDLTWTQLSSASTVVQPRRHSNEVPQNEDPRVAVILGYFNGDAYLSEQIHSILDQSHRNLNIFISDDNSTSEGDFTKLALVQKDAKKIYFGTRRENTGFTFNFLNALSCINASFEYFAFSDQDDIWHRDKLEDALAALEQHPKDRPALYCARTALTDVTCQTNLGTSPLFSKPPSFANALIQNIGGGNTMVFNRAARDLIVTSFAGTEVVSHDWWCYQIISGAGGVVHYDPKPCLKYRQHSNNLVGSNTSWSARVVRVCGLFSGKFQKWNDINLAALAKNQALLTVENQRILSDFIIARKSGLIRRLFLFKRTGIHRQTFFGNVGLLLGLLINKV